MRTKTKVHFTFMPGEIASELCGKANDGDRVTGHLKYATRDDCLRVVEELARQGSEKSNAAPKTRRDSGVV